MTGWRTVPLGELLTESRIEAKASDPERRITVKLNMKGVQRREPTAEKEGATRYYVRRAGQFIYGKQNLHKGAFGVIPKELDGHQSSSDLPAFDVAPVIAPEWIYYWLVKGETWRAFEKLARGVGSKRTNVDDFFRFKISYPIDKSEQQRIINRIRATEQKHEALTTELTHQRALLKQLRQAILQEAVQGKLTAAWRGSHPDPESSSGVSGSHHASELLKRIRAEKEALVKAGKLRKPKPLPPIKPEEVPFALPEGWVWCRLGEVITFLNGYAFESHKFSETGVRLVRNVNVGHGTIAWDDVARYPERELVSLDRFKLEAGDLVVSLDRPIIATGLKVALIREVDLPSMLLQRVACIRERSAVNVEYIYRWMLSDEFMGRINPGRSMGVPHISTTQLEQLYFPLPGDHEQGVIVALADKLFSRLEALELETSNQEHTTASLLQSVLSEVMGGPGAVRYAEAGDELPMAAEPQARRGRRIDASTQAHEGQ